MNKQPALIMYLSDTTIRIHELKTVSPYFEEVAAEAKKVEVRKDDRDFKVGDYLRLFYYDPDDHSEQNESANNWVWRRVTHILRDRPYCPEGYVIMSIEPVRIEVG